MAVNVCAACRDPLILQIDLDSDAEDPKESGTSSTQQAVPDDVELNCGCHFHWECLLEAYSITECPNCSKAISTLSHTGQQQVLCTVRNEGGLQKNFDILPPAQEEAYLRTYPEERKGHAYLQFCREGDVDAIVNLLKDVDDEDEDEDDTESIDVLRYQGTFEGIDGSGLHVAIRYNQVEVVWLLLVLGSSLDWSHIPPRVIQGMQEVNVRKEDRSSSPDIRTVTDSEGRTAADLARHIGGPWSDWLKDGRLGTQN